MLPSSTFNKNPLLSFAGIDSFDANGNSGGVILLEASEEKGKTRSCTKKPQISYDDVKN